MRVIEGPWLKPWKIYKKRSELNKRPNRIAILIGFTELSIHLTLIGSSRPAYNEDMNLELEKLRANKRKLKFNLAICG
jgi:hypothetical protein